MKWFYAQGPERQGPVSSEQLLALARDNFIADATLVWREGMTAWQAFATVKASLGIAPAGVPPPMAVPSIVPPETATAAADCVAIVPRPRFVRFVAATPSLRLLATWKT